MTTIGNNFGIAGQYNDANRAIDKKPSRAFGDLLATAVVQATVTPAVAAADATSEVSFSTRLGDALRSYGIDVPPAIRIISGPNGLSLSGDNRDTQFQAMLKDRPDIGQGISEMMGSAKLGRDDALDSVMSAFAGHQPSTSVLHFLDRFEAAQKQDTFSVKFNGVDATVEEKGKQGWEPVKDGKSFLSELVAAYTTYMTKNQVRDTSDKDDSDASAEMRKKLEDAKKESKVV